MPESRPLRHCDVCAGVDDHPRHVIGAAAGEGRTSDEVADRVLASIPPGGDVAGVVRGLRDDITIYRHMDCCRAVGCPADRPEDSCAVRTAGAEDKRGSALVRHLVKGN
jgi:hypothetical protein